VEVEKTFIANDGTRFDNQEDCEIYEQNRSSIVEKLNIIKATNKFRLFNKDGNELDICDKKAYGYSYYIYVEDDETRKRVKSLLVDEEKSYYSFYDSASTWELDKLFIELEQMPMPVILSTQYDSFTITSKFPYAWCPLDECKNWYKSERDNLQIIVDTYEKNINVIDKLQDFLNERRKGKQNEEI